MSDDPSQERLEELARSLEKISQKKLKQEILRHWYQGNEPYFDLFANTLNDELMWFQFTFRGNSICWSRQDPVVRTGVTTDLATNDVSFYSATKTVKLDDEINPAFFKFVRALLALRKDDPLMGSVLKILTDVTPG